MKLESHPNCPSSRSYFGRKTALGQPVGRRAADTEALYIRNPVSRQMKRVGMSCRLCGAIKMNGWTAWVKAT